MMAGIPTVLLAIETQQRKFNDPEKIKPVGGNRQLALRLQNVGAVQTDLAEDFARVQPLVGGKQNQITLLDGQFPGQRGLLGVVEKFYDGRFPFPALGLDERQAFRAEALRVFGHCLDLSLCGAGQSFGVERLHDAAVGDRTAEDFERAGAEFLGEVREFHAEARVRFVDAVAVQRLLEGEAFEWRRHVQVQRDFPDALEQPLNQVINVLAFNERHLDVNLRELRLAVGPQILVAVAARELEIFFDAGHHEDLLELLR